MDRKPYKATRPDIEWIAGRRVQPDEPLMLSEAEAEHDLARGNIEPAAPEAAIETGEESRRAGKG